MAIGLLIRQRIKGSGVLPVITRHYSKPQDHAYERFLVTTKEKTLFPQRKTLLQYFLQISFMTKQNQIHIWDNNNQMEEPLEFTKCFMSVMSSNPHKHPASFFLDLEELLKELAEESSLPHMPTLGPWPCLAWEGG